MNFIEELYYTSEYISKLALQKQIQEVTEMDMNIQNYLAFIKTVEYGSFTKAAEILNYSQSGISRMINDLEKEWNVSLLERNRT